MRLVPVLPILLALAAPAVAQTEQPYVWHEADPGKSIQYGIPDTDDRALRIDCEAPGKLAIMGPTASEAAEGAPIEVLLESRRFGRRLAQGTLIGLGDGSNFLVVTSLDDLAVAALLAGEPLTVGSAGDSWEVPNTGVQPLLKRLLAACRAKGPG